MESLRTLQSLTCLKALTTSWPSSLLKTCDTFSMPKNSYIQISMLQVAKQINTRLLTRTNGAITPMHTRPRRMWRPHLLLKT